MGATFGALHVKRGQLDRAAAWVEARLADRGFERIAESAPKDPGTERWVVVYEIDGWVVIADEEQTNLEDPDELARCASEELPGDVVAITVTHSDTARLRRFRNGARRGGFLVGGPSGRKKKLASTKFLVDLAASPEAQAELEAGLRADHAFPEAKWPPRAFAAQNAHYPDFSAIFGVGRDDLWTSPGVLPWGNDVSTTWQILGAAAR